MSFSAVIAQEKLKSELPELFLENRLAHAILFLGKEGSGDLPLAIAFAQYLMCDKVSQSNEGTANSLFGGDEPQQQMAYDACGVCPSCMKAKELIHPDIHFSYPVVPKKSGGSISDDYRTAWREFITTNAYGNVYDWLQFIGAENKQGNISVHECNEIAKKLSLKSFEGGFKILVMWLPEYLGTEGNKLLKLIEEPPPKTILFFVAQNEGAILPTILSRCQLIRVPLLQTKEIAAALIERNNVAAEVANRVATISDGSYREALALLQNASEDWQTHLRDWLNAVMKTGPAAQVQWIDEISKLGRENQKQFLKYFIHLLQLSIRISISSGFDEDKLPEKEVDFANRINRILNFEQQSAIINEVNNAIYYIERNANSKMLFMALTIKMYHIIQDKIVFLNE